MSIRIVVLNIKKHSTLAANHNKINILFALITKNFDRNQIEMQFHRMKDRRIT